MTKILATFAALVLLGIPAAAAPRSRAEVACLGAAWRAHAVKGPHGSWSVPPAMMQAIRARYARLAAR